MSEMIRLKKGPAITPGLLQTDRGLTIAIAMAAIAAGKAFTAPAAVATFRSVIEHRALLAFRAPCVLRLFSGFFQRHAGRVDGLDPIRRNGMMHATGVFIILGQNDAVTSAFVDSADMLAVAADDWSLGANNAVRCCLSFPE